MLTSGQGTQGSLTKDFEKGLVKLEKANWEFGTAKLDTQSALAGIIENQNFFVQIPLPTIKVACCHCDSVLPPHNPGYSRREDQRSSHIFALTPEPIQLFEASFQCQSCKGEPLVFMIQRKGLKLTMVGRSQFQPVSTPKFLPDEIRDYYRKAVIAHRTGFTLAAILYLRVLIEQWMRKSSGVEGRYDLADLGESYAKTLPEDFRSRFPSLKKACDDLSVAIHAADENAGLFTKTIGDVEKHFDALRLFELLRKK
jgi:hypothetical protein